MLCRTAKTSIIITLKILVRSSILNRFWVGFADKVDILVKSFKYLGIRCVTVAFVDIIKLFKGQVNGLEVTYKVRYNCLTCLEDELLSLILAIGVLIYF